MKKLATLLSFVLALDALACRFNVRDVGFVDLGSEKYRLLIFVPDGTPAAEVESLKSIAYATYLESNVIAKVFTASAAAKGETAQFLPADLKRAQAVLISADGKRLMPVSLTVEGKPLSVSAWDGLESVFDSIAANIPEISPKVIGALAGFDSFFLLADLAGRCDEELLFFLNHASKRPNSLRMPCISPRRWRNAF